MGKWEVLSFKDWTVSVRVWVVHQQYSLNWNQLATGLIRLIRTFESCQVETSGSVWYEQLFHSTRRALRNFAMQPFPVHKSNRTTANWVIAQDQQKITASHARQHAREGGGSEREGEEMQNWPEWALTSHRSNWKLQGVRKAKRNSLVECKLFQRIG